MAEHGAEKDVPECDHPGIEHGPFSYCWPCPGCGVCKMIGHGPLCVDCLNARVFRPE